MDPTLDACAVANAPPVPPALSSHPYASPSITGKHHCPSHSQNQDNGQDNGQDGDQDNKQNEEKQPRTFHQERARRLSPRQLLSTQCDDVLSTPSSLTTPPAMPTRKESGGDVDSAAPPAPPYMLDTPSSHGHSISDSTWQHPPSLADYSPFSEVASPASFPTPRVDRRSLRHVMLAPDDDADDRGGGFLLEEDSVPLRSFVSSSHGSHSHSSTDNDGNDGKHDDNDDKHDNTTDPSSMATSAIAATPVATNKSNLAGRWKQVADDLARDPPSEVATLASISDAPPPPPPSQPVTTSKYTPSSQRKTVASNNSSNNNSSSDQQHNAAMRQEKLRIAHGALTGTRMHRRHTSVSTASKNTQSEGMATKQSSLMTGTTNTTVIRRNAKSIATTPITSAIPTDLLPTHTHTHTTPPADGQQQNRNGQPMAHNAPPPMMMTHDPLNDAVGTFTITPRRPTTNPVYVTTTSLSRQTSVNSGITLDSSFLRDGTLHATPQRNRGKPRQMGRPGPSGGSRGMRRASHQVAASHGDVMGGPEITRPTSDRNLNRLIDPVAPPSISMANPPAVVRTSLVADRRPAAYNSAQQKPPPRSSDDKRDYRAPAMPPPSRSLFAASSSARNAGGRPSDQKAAYRKNPSVGRLPKQPPSTMSSPNRDAQRRTQPVSRPSDSKHSFRRNPSIGMAPMPPSMSPALSTMRKTPAQHATRPSDAKAAYRHNPSAGMVPTAKIPPRQSSQSPARRQPRPSDDKSAYRSNPSAGMVAAKPSPYSAHKKPPPIMTASIGRPLPEGTKPSPPSNTKSDHSNSSALWRQPSLGVQVSVGRGSNALRSRNLATSHNLLVRQPSSNTLDSGLDLDDDVRDTIFARSSPRRMVRGIDRATSQSSSKSIVSDDDEVASLMESTIGADRVASFPTNDEKAAYRTSRMPARPPTLRRSYSGSTANSGMELTDHLRNTIVQRSHAAAMARRQVSVDALRQSLTATSSDSASVIDDITMTRHSDQEDADRNAKLAASMDYPRRSRRGRNLMALEDQVAMKISGRNVATLQEADATSEGAASSSNLSTTARPTATEFRQGAVASEDQLINLEAQAGVPVVLPGAFAIDGVDSNGANQAGYDSAFEDSSADDASAAPQDQPEDAAAEEAEVPAVVPVDHTPLEAQLYEGEGDVDAVDAEVFSEAEELEKSRRVRRKQRCILLCCIIVFTSVILGATMGLLLSRDGGGQAATGIGGCPVIDGWAPAGGTIVGPTDDDGILFGFSVAMNGNGNRIAVGLPGLDGEGDAMMTKVGAVRILDYNGTTWSTVGTLKGPGRDAQAGTVVSMSTDGTVVAVGSPTFDGNGQVEIFQQSSTESAGAAASWTSIAVLNSTLPDLSDGRFGGAVSLSADGNVVAVGDRNTGENTGSVQVFERDQQGEWIKLGGEILGEQPSDLFGWVVSLSSDGRRLMATARGAGGFAGAVRVYDLIDDAWVSTFNVESTQSRENLGSALSFSSDGRTLAIGSEGYNRDENDVGVGRAVIYRQVDGGDAWQRLGGDIVGQNAFDSFGAALALSDDGNVLAIGAPEHGTCDGDSSGSISVYTFEGTDWQQTGSSLSNIEPAEGAEYGFAVAMSADGRRVVGGAPLTTFNGILGDVGLVQAFSLVDVQIE